MSLCSSVYQTLQLPKASFVKSVTSIETCPEPPVKQSTEDTPNLRVPFSTGPKIPTSVCDSEFQEATVLRTGYLTNHFFTVSLHILTGNFLETELY